MAASKIQRTIINSSVISASHCCENKMAIYLKRFIFSGFLLKMVFKKHFRDLN